MSFFVKWDESFSVNVPDMNEEHKKLINIMNKLHAFNKCPEIPALGSILTEFEEYTIAHFQNEEKYMEEIGYAELDTHKVIHQQLLSTLREHVEAFKKRGGGLSDEFFTFLGAHVAPLLRVPMLIFFL